jgi:hypothetical protein
MSTQEPHRPIRLADGGYRWIVMVKRVDMGVGLPYVREVATDGPWPDKALVHALERINEGDNDLWQAQKLDVSVERVR